MSKKSETGLQIIIRGFIVTNGSIEVTNEATSAYLHGTKTGDYGPLLSMMTVEAATANMRTRRIADTEPGHVKDDAGVVDIEEMIDKTAA